MHWPRRKGLALTLATKALYLCVLPRRLLRRGWLGLALALRPALAALALRRANARLVRVGVRVRGRVRVRVRARVGVRAQPLGRARHLVVEVVKTAAAARRALLLESLELDARHQVDAIDGARGLG